MNGSHIRTTTHPNHTTFDDRLYPLLMLSALFSSLPVSCIYYRLTRASSHIQSFLLCRSRIRSTLFSSPHLLLSYHLSHPSSSLLSSCVLFSSLIHYIFSSPPFPYLLCPSLLFLLPLSFFLCDRGNGIGWGRGSCRGRGRGNGMQRQGQGHGQWQRQRQRHGQGQGQRQRQGQGQVRHIRTDNR